MHPNMDIFVTLIVVQATMLYREVPLKKSQISFTFQMLVSSLPITIWHMRWQYGIEEKKHSIEHNPLFPLPSI